jgi:hypothetical protein
MGVSPWQEAVQPQDRKQVVQDMKQALQDRQEAVDLSEEMDKDATPEVPHSAEYLRLFPVPKAPRIPKKITDDELMLSPEEGAYTRPLLNST